MNELFEYQEQVSARISNTFFRSLYHNMDWDSRFLGIIGLRGVGKTTMLLQYLKYDVPPSKKALYVTADHPWFYDHTLLDVANQFSKYGGNIFLSTKSIDIRIGQAN
ncbi:AAA family ATPase [Rhodohalobacter sp.]|uniref:AAA family ATPase n=1 Tax=Rhodohalobacter sp. TaxID=1974210 RepID=UPI002ACE1AF1|nr:AAA family ATPase [Rhodohalobacter sp.]MDZ7756777.1 AAA family ATPase [Rhodohalobacter sp.]